MLLGWESLKRILKPDDVSRGHLTSPGKWGAFCFCGIRLKVLRQLGEGVCMRLPIILRSTHTAKIQRATEQFVAATLAVDARHQATLSELRAALDDYREILDALDAITPDIPK